MCCILCVCIYVITLYCIYGMFLIDYGTPVLFKSLFLKLFIKALLSRLLDTSAIEIHYYYIIIIIRKVRSNTLQSITNLKQKRHG